MPVNQWPSGTGQWKRVVRTVIVGLGPNSLAKPHGDDAVVVVTPLDLILQLEASEQLVSTVVLDGDPAVRGELASFLLETYPWVRVVERSHPEPLPA